MYAEERQRAIATLATSRGNLLVNDLAIEFGVTSETVRRDLAVLEREGKVRRVHGGAVAPDDLTVVEAGVTEREFIRAAQKERIARAAAELVPPRGGSLLLDAGTTTGRMIGLLPVDRDLVVVTNSVPIAARLATTTGVRLVMVGGQVRGVTQAAVGAIAVRTLQQLRVDVAFLGTNAISATRGLTTPDPDEGAVKRAMIDSARRAVVLADSSKLGAELLVRFGELDVVDTLITDDDADPDTVAGLEKAGVEVIQA